MATGSVVRGRTRVGTGVWSVSGAVRSGSYASVSVVGSAYGGVIGGARSSPTRNRDACVDVIISNKGGRAALMGLVQVAKWRSIAS